MIEAGAIHPWILRASEPQYKPSVYTDHVLRSRGVTSQSMLDLVVRLENQEPCACKCVYPPSPFLGEGSWFPWKNPASRTFLRREIFFDSTETFPEDAAHGGWCLKG